MARPLRIEYSGAVYHVTSRGNERKPIYLDDDDRRLFLDILARVNSRYNWLCHAYCLMDNHYHLVIETVDGNLSKGMRQLNGIYTQAFNRKHSRVGHLFQGRYKAILVDKDSYLLEVCRYVVLNPVRAKAVRGPEDWEWSSYRGTAGMGLSHPSIKTEWVLEQFNSRKEVAKEEYVDFIKDGMERSAIWADIRNQIILGKDDFVSRFGKYAKGSEDLKEIPKGQRYVNRLSLKELFKSDEKDKEKRDCKIREAVENYGYSQKEIADFTGMHYSTISRLVNQK
jgi:REP element-mobilizing transposase RayT